MKFIIWLLFFKFMFLFMYMFLFVFVLLFIFFFWYFDRFTNNISMLVNEDQLSIMSDKNVYEKVMELFKSFSIKTMKLLHKIGILWHERCVNNVIIFWFVADNGAEIGFSFFICHNLVVVEILMVNHDNVVSVIHEPFLAKKINALSHSIFKWVFPIRHHFHC